MIPTLKTHPDAILPERQHASDAGYDLCALEEVCIRAGQTVKVRTGLSVELPAHLFGWIVGRSGHATRSIQVLGGVIDPGYRGEIHVLVHYLAGEGRTCLWIPKGNRIAQMLILPRINVTFHPVVSLTESDRGQKGLGSTGV